LTKIRDTKIAVSIDVAMPMLRVMAKPLIGPVPKLNNTMAAIKVVKLASIMVENALS